VLIVHVQADEGHLYAQVPEQQAGVPGVFGGYTVSRSQGFYRTQGNVLQVANRRGYQDNACTHLQ
jgi:hypothetical protein